MTEQKNNNNVQLPSELLQQLALAQLQNTSAQQQIDDEIDLAKLWHVIWNGKWLIIAITTIFTVGAVAHALSLPNLYKSEALLAPAEQKNGEMASRFGGLASLAGINIGGGIDKTALALEIMRSRIFVKKFISNNELLVPLMAAIGWDQSKNKLIYDETIYDKNKQLWIQETKENRSAKPSEQKAIEKFKKNFSVVQDKKTSMLTVTVNHFSPFIAKQWVEWLIEAINLEMKLKDLGEAKKSISYLEEAVKKTRLNELRQVQFQIIEEQTKIIMFAEVREQYAFRTIDPAVVPERKSGPKRALICILGAMFGGGVGLLINYIMHIRRKIS